MDAGTAFVGGLVVFATLGYYAQTTGQPIESVVKAGPSLAFVTYPTIISLFPVLPQVIGILFFLMLFTLGIDSAFSLVESVVTGIMDKFNTPRLPTLLGVGATGLVIGIFFCTGSGLLWLDVVDHFMNQYGLMTVCLMEAVFIGWVYKTDDLRQYVNKFSELRVGSWWNWLLRYFIPVVLTVLLVSWLGDRINASYENYSRGAEFLGGWLLVCVLPVIALFLAQNRQMAPILAVFSAAVLLCSVYAYQRGLDFSAIVIFDLAFIVLFGGTALCITRSRRHAAEIEAATDTVP